MSSFTIASILYAPMENPFHISLYDDVVSYPDCGICIGHCSCTDHNQFAAYFEPEVVVELNDTETQEEAPIEYVYVDEAYYEIVEEVEDQEEFEIVELEEYNEELPQQFEVEENQEEVEIHEVAAAADDNNLDSYRCSTPVQNEWEERWEIIKDLCFTERQKEMEIDAKEVAAMNYKETCFTVVKDEDEFVIVVPFGDKPVYKSVAFPVSEEMMQELFLSIPSWVGYRIRELATLEGFSEFARFFKYHGPSYRLAVLMRRALNAVKRPEQQRILNEMLPVEDEVEEIVEEPDCRIREGREKRDAAAEIDGRTPLGRRLPMRQRVLFRDEEDGEERVVKRRRLNLELED